MKHYLRLAAALVIVAFPAWAETPEYNLVIEDHQFQPAELSVPADVRMKLVIENRDASPEEFESHDLNREKIIPAHGQVSIFVGPLAAGTYRFFGEFHPATAQGTLTVK